MSSTLAVFPGSFDPFSAGHYDVALRALRMFDRVVVAIGVNAEKHCLYSPIERQQAIEKAFANEPRVQACTYEGLTVDLCQRLGATHIVRGVRNAADFEAELVAAQANKAMLPEVDTVLLPASPSLTFVSSTIIRDIIKNGGNADIFLPQHA
jgi:pantetheine-phosphate adenylyltransferase